MEILTLSLSNDCRMSGYVIKRTGGGWAGGGGRFVEVTLIVAQFVISVRVERQARRYESSASFVLL
jgi:hypothetical protein